MSPIFFLVVAAALAVPVWIVQRFLPKMAASELPEHIRVLCIPCKLCPIIVAPLMLVMIHMVYVMDGFALFFLWMMALLIVVSMAMFLRYFKKNAGNVLLLILNVFLSYAYFFFLLLIVYPGVD